MRERRQWTTARYLIGDREKRAGKDVPAVRLGFSLAKRRGHDGDVILWSHTPGVMRAKGNGVASEEFVPLFHLRGDYLEEYLELLLQSATLAAKAEHAIDRKQSGGPTLTVTLAEAVIGKLRA